MNPRIALEYNQAHKDWGYLTLGLTSSTCARYGCYATVVTAFLAGTFQVKNAQGNPITPYDFITAMNKAGGFSGDQVDWQGLTKVFPDVELYGRDYTTALPNANIQKVEIDEALRRCARMHRMGMGVGLCVDAIPGDGVNPDHIVALVDNPTGNPMDWKIMDPAVGKVIRFADRYGDPRTGVKGYRIVVGPPTEYPEQATEEDKRVGTAGWKANCAARGRHTGTYLKEVQESIFFHRA